MKRRARIKTGLFLIGSLHFRSFTSREQTIQLWLRSSVGEGVGSGGGGGARRLLVEVAVQNCGACLIL